MAEEPDTSTFPCFCNCCEVPVSLKNKQAKYYHITKSNSAKIRRGEIMPPKVKKPKVEYSNAGEEFLFSKLDLFVKNVVKDNFHTTRLETNVEDLEDDLEDETRLQIRDLCLKKLEEWEDKIASVRENTTTHYDASTETEKSFLRSLSAKTAQLAEAIDREGNHHAGIPPTYQKSEEDLRFLLADMKARVEAIEYELVRREFEPEKIVYDFFAERYAPRRREGYTQEY
jgi:hypothetical protein